MKKFIFSDKFTEASILTALKVGVPFIRKTERQVGSWRDEDKDELEWEYGQWRANCGST